MVTAGQVITCRAAVAWDADKPLSIESVQVSPPRANEVRVKILYGTVCHTDLVFLSRKAPGPKFWPRILGHEAAGVVESVGEGVTEFQEGDHVIPVYQAECNECPLCQTNATNLCMAAMNLLNGYMYSTEETRFSIDGKPVYHFFNISTFSEYTVVNKSSLVKVHSQAPLDRIFLFGCGVSTGHGAVKRIANVQPGSTVAVFGLGTIGLAVVQAATASGATKIIGIDINPKKFPLAEQFGVTDTLNPLDSEKPVQQVIKDMTGGLGVTSSFECVGGNTQVSKSAIECVNPIIFDNVRLIVVSPGQILGTAVLIGTPSENEVVPIPTALLCYGLKVKGVMFGGYKGKTDVPKLVELYMNKEIDLDKFITDKLPFSRINEAFDMMKTGECLRCLLDYSQ